MLQPTDSLSTSASPPAESGQDGPPAPAASTSPALAQRDWFIYWSVVRAQALPLTQAGQLRKRALRLVNKRLLWPDPSLEGAARESAAPRLHFIRLLLQELGLLTQDRTEVRTSHKRGQVPEFWRQSVEDRARAALDAYVGMQGWTEWSSPGMSPFDLDLAQARRTLLEQLRLLEPMTWVPTETFLSHLASVVPRLLFDSHTSRLLRAPHDRSASIKGQGHSLTAIQAAFVDHALGGPLHWMGLLDTRSDKDRLLAFRINISAASVLHIPPDLEGTRHTRSVEQEQADSEYKVIVQPNFQVFALGPVPADILARLEMFADRIKVDRSAFEYLLSRQTVYRGQQDGVPVHEIVAFLDQTSSVPLPQNVLRTLREWGQRHERIVFHRSVSLLQAASPDLLEELWDDAALHMHLQRRLTPTVALIRGGRWAAVQEALLKRNMLPASSQDRAPCPGRVQAMQDGELRPVHPGPDLLLEACLRRLAVERDGGFYVTEAAVTEALAGGMTVAEYLDRLAALNGGPVPPGLEAHIKAWGHYYGKASLREATLLEVRDAATAEELLADPELAAHLSRLPGDPNGRTLLVRTEDTEALRSLLQDRGIELT